MDYANDHKPKQPQRSTDAGTRITQAFYAHLEGMLTRATLPKGAHEDLVNPETGEVTRQWVANPEYLELKAADLECIRKALLDNNLKLSSVERGDFGKVVKSALDDFPDFGDEAERRSLAN